VRCAAYITIIVALSGWVSPWPCGVECAGVERSGCGDLAVPRFSVGNRSGRASKWALRGWGCLQHCGALTCNEAPRSNAQRFQKCAHLYQKRAISLGVKMLEKTLKTSTKRRFAQRETKITPARFPVLGADWSGHGSRLTRTWRSSTPTVPISSRMAIHNTIASSMETTGSDQR
jgi:hypothetical protein